MTPETMLQFLHTAELLKCRTRHSYTSSGRHESVAEHSWRTALMAELLRPEFPQLDMDRVVTMCLLHDLGEAVTGDIPTFEKTKTDEETEEAAIFRLLAALPQPTRSRMEALFDEMLALGSAEARLYKALDRMEAVISHNEAPLETWLPLEYDLQRTYGVREAASDPTLAALRAAVLRETEEKIAAGTEPAKENRAAKTPLCL